MANVKFALLLCTLVQKSYRHTAFYSYARKLELLEHAFTAGNPTKPARIQCSKYDWKTDGPSCTIGGKNCYCDL